MDAKPPNHPKKPPITHIHANVVTWALSTWRGPGRRTTARNRWVGTPLRIQAFVTVSRPNGLRSASAGLAKSLLLSRIGKVEERQKRHAKGVSAGEKRGGDERLGSEPASFSPETGDHPIACRSAANKRKHLTSSATTPWCLGVLEFLLDEWADLCSSV